MSSERPSTGEGWIFSFHSQAFPETISLFVESLEGHEAISSPYRYELVLRTRRSDVDPEQLFRLPARVHLKRARGSKETLSFKLFAIVSSIEQQIGMAQDPRTFRVVLAPRLARLRQGLQTRLFLDRSVPEVVTEVLHEYGLEPKSDFEFHFSREYPKHSQLAQYRESDLDFLSRLLEREGISYYFAQVQEADYGGDRILFADDLKAVETSPLLYGVPYLPIARGKKSRRPHLEEAVHFLASTQDSLPREVVLKDYADPTPSLNLEVSEPVAKEGIGVHYEFGERFRTPEEGQVLAKIRAEELRCHALRFRGRSNVALFHVGLSYEQVGGSPDSFNRTYLLTEVHHYGGQTDPRLTGETMDGESPEVEAHYENEFVAIPSGVEFRPKRITRRPQIGGTLTALVDSAGDGKVSELDESGRNRLRILFDRSGRGEGKASPAIRRVQPYAGAAEGLHCPLRPGTEVQVGFVNGDPDRPIITGAVPNPETPSPVTGANATQSILKSARDNALLLDDQEGAERLFLRAQKDFEIRACNDTRELVVRDQHVTVERNQLVHVKNDRHEKIDRDLVQEVAGSRHLSVAAHEIMDVAGHWSCTVQGNAIHLFQGDHSESTAGVSSLRAGNVVIHAASGITLSSGGGNCIVLDESGVTLKGARIVLDGGETRINSGSGASPVSAPDPDVLVAKAPLPPCEPGNLAGPGNALPTGAGSVSAGVGSTAVGTDASWIALALRDKAGNPIPQELYEVRFPTGLLVRGRLDKEGKARIEGVPPGKAEISFLRRDQDQWQRA